MMNLVHTIIYEPAKQAESGNWTSWIMFNYLAGQGPHDPYLAPVTAACTLNSLVFAAEPMFSKKYVHASSGQA
jgi:hypothetical protein